MLHGRFAGPRGVPLCVIWRSLQATPASLEREYRIARQLGACFGAKLVRGAYLARERQLAQQQGRASPVCDTYEDTSANYNR